MKTAANLGDIEPDYDAPDVDIKLLIVLRWRKVEENNLWEK